jgi:hypothetical protein
MRPPPSDEPGRLVGRIRRVVDDITAGNTTPRDAASSMSGDIRRLLETTRRRSGQKDPDLETLINQLDGLTSQLSDTEAFTEEGATAWTAKTVPLLDLIDGRLREMRRQTNVGASTA